jgi:GntR family transcriptional regulator/MocR family aminotransferase
MPTPHAATRKNTAMLDILSLDRAGAEPLHRQLYKQLRDLILSGGLKPRMRLPSSRSLSQELGISRNTVLNAYEQLLAEGYLDGQVGSGSFVAARLPDELLTVNRGMAHAMRRAGPAHLSKRAERATLGLHDPDPLYPAIFTPGIPALDAFPLALWEKLAAKVWRQRGRALLCATDLLGDRSLRAAIARHIGASRGVLCDPDQVVIVASTRQAIDLALRLLTDPGDTVWLEEPSFLGARAAMEMSGVRIIPVPVDADGLNVTAGRATAPQARLAYVTPSHQYPLGRVMSLARRLEILDWASQSDAWILEDDYDGEFRYGGRPLTALHGLDREGRVLYMGTFSKVTFPSLRLAYLIAPPALVDGLAATRRTLDGHSPSAAQAILADFIAEGYFATHLRRMRRLYHERQECLLDLAARHWAGLLRIAPSEAGMHLVARFETPTDDQRVVAELRDSGVMPSPLSSYYHQPAGAEPGLLLGYAAADAAALRKGVAAVARAYDKATSRSSAA